MGGWAILSLPEGKSFFPEYLCTLDNNMGVHYEVSGEESLDQIEPLWLQLRQMHCVRSTYFKGVLGDKTFQERRDELLEKSSGGLLRVELARDDDGRIIAYCVSSIDQNLRGEVDSIFVAVEHRRMGIGTRLMDGSMRWMDGLGVRTKVLTAIVGNEAIHQFYVRFGFLPKHVLLERVIDAGQEKWAEQLIK